MKAGKLLLALVVALGPALARADAPAETGSSELSLPWEAFQKLLQLNQDNVTLSWSEWQNLLKQTGVTQPPPYQVQNGQVVLSRKEFRDLLDRMKPPAGDAPKAYLTKALYEGTVGRRSARVTARLLLHVTGRPTYDSPFSLPLFPVGTALEEVRVDGRSALVEAGDNGVNLRLTRGGEMEVTAVFAVTGQLDKPPYQLTFPVPRTPITRVDVTLPQTQAHADIPGAMGLETTAVAGGTRLKASLTPTSQIQISWNAAEPERAQGPAKTYASGHHLLTVEEDAIKVTSRLDLEILQNTLGAVNVAVPEGYTVVDVQGDGVGDWRAGTARGNVLVVPLTAPRRGGLALTLTAEIPLKDKNAVVEYTGFSVIGAVRENGDLGVENKTAAEIKPTESGGLLRLDPQEAGGTLLALTPRPLTYAYTFSRPGYRLTLDVRRHEEVAVLSSVVDEANGVTLVLEDGKQVHHLTYTVRNSWKQFMEVRLPKGAQLWNAFVEGKRVRPSQGDGDKLLVPLNRSRTEGEAGGFDVELLYFVPGDRPWALGREKFAFPTPDMLMSRMLWSVYLPTRDDYIHFGGTVDKEAGATGLKPLLTAAAGKKSILRNLAAEAQAELGSTRSGNRQDRLRKSNEAKNSAQWEQRGSFSAAQSVDEGAYARQVEREMNFFAQVRQSAAEGDAGALRIQIPNAGQVYRFTKTIVTDADSLRLTTFFVNGAVIKGTKLLLLAGLAFLLYRFRNVFQGIAAGRAGKIFARRKEAAAWAASPGGSLIASTAGTLLLKILGFNLLAGMAFVFFVGTAVRYFLPRWRKTPLTPPGAKDA
jgi:hypothetical protein